jgi:hypothetical protein
MPHTAAQNLFNTYNALFCFGQEILPNKVCSVGLVGAGLKGKACDENGAAGGDAAQRTSQTPTCRSERPQKPTGAMPEGFFFDQIRRRWRYSPNRLSKGSSNALK